MISLTSLKLKTYLSKGTLNKIKRQSIDQEKILPVHISVRELLFIVSKEILDLNNKKSNIFIKKGKTFE